MYLRTLLLLTAAGLTFGQGVTFDRILNAGKEPQNWLTYSGSTQGQRIRLLNQITPANVKNLELQWVWQARSTEKFETTALVVDGVMYTIQAPDDVVALDAVTGRIFWTLPLPQRRQRQPLLRARESRARHSRRHAVHGHLDAHLLAIDAKSGKMIWNTRGPPDVRPSATSSRTLR